MEPQYKRGGRWDLQILNDSFANVGVFFAKTLC